MRYRYFPLTGEVYDPYYTTEPLVWIEIYFENLVDFNDSFFDKYRNNLFYTPWVEILYDVNKVRMRVLKEDLSQLDKYNDNLLELQVFVNPPEQQNVEYAESISEIDKIINTFDLSKLPDVANRLSRIINLGSQSAIKNGIFELRFEKLMGDINELDQDMYQSLSTQQMVCVLKMHYLDISLDFLEVIISKINKNGSLKRINDFINLVNNDHDRATIIITLFNSDVCLQQDALDKLTNSPNIAPAIIKIADDIIAKQHANDKDLKVSLNQFIDQHNMELAQQDLASISSDEIYAMMDMDDENGNNETN